MVERLGPILIGIDGEELDAESRALLGHADVGGVVLFSRNYRDRKQLQSLISDIRKLRQPRLLVCIDQEGGRVQRLRTEFTSLPALGVLGQLYAEDPVKAADMAYRHGRVMATEMLEIGIDMSFAPVLDLDRGSRVIGDRAFASDPQTVCELGRAYLAGMHDAGMRATGKHFPGHGSILADSHHEDVCDDRPLEEIEQSDLRPFRELSANLDALMIAHVIYPRIDTLPAGYSRTWLLDILRGKLAFDGVIVSDDLGMHAAKAVGGLVDRTQLCLRAGCDLVLVCKQAEADELLRQLSGELNESTALIASLYGQASLPADQLAQVNEQGIREWRHWQRSLESLEKNSWI
jgi:beta-N-acetylhexosaminidase